VPDVAFVGLAVVFFALAIGYVQVCQRLLR